MQYIFITFAHNIVTSLSLYKNYIEALSHENIKKVFFLNSNN